MVAQELLTKLKQFNGFTSDMLYNDLILLDINSRYDRAEYDKFALAFSLFHIGKLTLEELDKVSSNIDKLPQEKVANIRKTLKEGFLDWIPLSKVEKNIFKIYLSVDNNSLHLFINEFLRICLEKEIDDYDFKINNDENLSRRDNVVIYCNQNNFGTYIELIEEVLKRKPTIKFNNPHLLGMKYNEHIYCGIDFDEGKVSYTDKICQGIFSALKRGESPENIVCQVEMKKLRQEPAIHLLAENSKKK